MTNPKFRSSMSQFGKDTGGNIAIMFSLAALPLMFFTGFAIDYSRGISEQAKIQVAADSTALALVNQPGNLTPAQLDARGQQLFRAFLGNSAATPVVTIRVDGTGVQVTGRSALDTSLMRVAGVPAMQIGATSAATFSKRKVEIALVLDNTGSMAQSGKMPALKAAVNDFISKLEALPVPAGSVKMSVVPFNTQVKIGTSYSGAIWLNWHVTLENPALGPLAQPPVPASWGGCISDRDQNYDSESSPPMGGSSNYVAARCEFAPLIQMQPLTSNLESIRTSVNAMQPAGTTNLAVGFTTGLATLRSDSPLGTESSDLADVQKFLVLLTDGDNTMNRWGGDGSDNSPFVPQIDQRTRQSCQTAKTGATQRITVFTIRVIQGNATLLQDCASSPGNYYPATSAADIAPAFESILNKIANVRLTM